MRIEDLDKKIEYCEKQIELSRKRIQEMHEEQKIEQMYASIYEATLHFLTKDWEGEKPVMKVFMKNSLSKRAFEFWDLHKDDLFDIQLEENKYLSELEWNHRLIR